MSFLDDFSRYTWIFPIAYKSDIFTIFNQFKIYVERYFSPLIKTVESDWGGEYRSLSKILQQYGITHCISCPHTHQQNGVVERKHYHIVETSLTLLSFASIPHHFWDDSFVTACYLINQMPTSTLKNQYPFEVLFKTPLDYKFLRIFGYAYWPHLKPYNSNKLQPRSTHAFLWTTVYATKATNAFIIQLAEFIFLEMFSFKKTSFLLLVYHLPQLHTRLPVSHLKEIVVHLSLSSCEILESTSPHLNPCEHTQLIPPSSLFPHEALPPDTSPPTNPCTTPHPSPREHTQPMPHSSLFPHEVLPSDTSPPTSSCLLHLTPLPLIPHLNLLPLSAHILPLLP